MELVYVYISYVNIFCQRALLCYTNIVDKFSRSAKFTGIFQPTHLPFKSYCYYVTCTMYNIYVWFIFCLMLMLAYICFPPSLRGNFCNTKFVYDFVVFSFECHLNWQFSSNIWILCLRHLMNKWQFSFIVCLLCFCPQTELACVDKNIMTPGRVFFVIFCKTKLKWRVQDSPIV